MIVKCKLVLIGIIILATFIIAMLLASVVQPQGEEHLPYGAPSDTGILLYREGYVASFNVERGVADWVCYHLTAEYLRDGVKRKNNFRADPDVPSGPTLTDYRGSGFDRGHLAPAGDMKRSKQVMSESFLLTNMAPQHPAFNRGIWKTLETQVRKWAVEYEDINVCTGPIYFSDGGHEPIGDSVVAVPNSFYKIVVLGQGKELSAIAYILQNAKYRILSGDALSLVDSIYSVDEVEDLTGLDFLSSLPDDLEERIESKSSFLHEPTSLERLDARVAEVEWRVEYAEREVELFVCFEKFVYLKEDGTLGLEEKSYTDCKERAYATTN